MTDTLENVSVSVTNNFIFTTMNNFQDELIKRLEQDYQQAKARNEAFLQRDDRESNKEAIAFSKAIMIQAKTTLFDIREINAELSL